MRRVRSFGPLAALLVSVCAAQAAAQAAGGQAPGRVLLGVRLRPEVAAWLEEVERRTGREVYAEFAPLGPEDESEGFVGGENYVTERGTAVLRINLSFQSPSMRRRLEATLAHEILHLRQRARGFPAYAFDRPNSSPRTPVAEFERMELAGALMEAVEHRAILPELRRLGLDTAADMVGGLAWARAQGASEDHPLHAVYYMRALEEFGDPALVRELEAIYRRNRWARSLRRGARMGEILRASALATPAEMTTVYLRCLTELFGGLYRFEARTAPQDFPRDRLFPTVPLTVAPARRRVRP